MCRMLLGLTKICELSPCPEPSLLPQKIEFVIEVANANHPPAFLEAIRKDYDLLRALGHEVELAQPVAFSDEEFSRHYVTIVAVATAVDFDTIGETIGRPVGRIISCMPMASSTKILLATSQT